jgi:hypothetical protein
VQIRSLERSEEEGEGEEGEGGWRKDGEVPVMVERSGRDGLREVPKGNNVVCYLLMDEFFPSTERGQGRKERRGKIGGGSK